jgi:hypothetical protein
MGAWRAPGYVIPPEPEPQGRPLGPPPLDDRHLIYYAVLTVIGLSAGWLSWLLW